MIHHLGILYIPCNIDLLVCFVSNFVRSQALPANLSRESLGTRLTVSTYNTRCTV